MRPYKRMRTFDPLKVENDAIGEIMQRELAAIEAYKNVIKGVSQDPHTFRLHQFQLNHRDALQYWKKEASVTGKIEAGSVRVWQKVVECFVGVTKLLGEKAALVSLKKGEEYCLQKYNSLVDSDLLSPLQKAYIKDTFIPRQKRHIEAIERLINHKEEEHG